MNQKYQNLLDKSNPKKPLSNLKKVSLKKGYIKKNILNVLSKKSI